MNEADESPIANQLFKLCDELFEKKGDSTTEIFPRQVILNHQLVDSSIKRVFRWFHFHLCLLIYQTLGFSIE